MVLPQRRFHESGGTPSTVPSTNPEEALEPALRAVLVASDAAAGAICLYDESDDVLRLVLEVGVSNEGCRRLRRISLGDPASWLAPLLSVHSGRLQLLTRSSGADLPPLLEPADEISALACIPLRAEGRPRASLILIGLGPSELDATNLREADAAVAKISRIVEAIRRRVRAAASEQLPPDLDAMLVASTTRRRLESLAGPDQARESDQPSLADVGFRAILTESNEIGVQESRVRARSTDFEHPTKRLAEVERVAAGEHSLRVEQRSGYERTRLRIETERTETTRRAREFVSGAESLRSSAAAEAESTRGALARAQRLELEARRAAQRMQAEADAARASEKAMRAEREQLVQALEAAQVSAAEAASRHRQLERESAALAAAEGAGRVRAAEVDACWRASLAEAGREIEQERRRGAERAAECLSLGRQLEDAAAREVELRAEIDAVVQRSSREQAETLRRALETERTAEAARAAATMELEALRTALGEAQRIILDAEGRPPDDERLLYAAELSERAEQARAAAVLELEAARNALAAAQDDVLSTRAYASRVLQEAHAVASERHAAVTEAAQLATALEGTRIELGEARARAVRLEGELAESRERVSRMEIEVATREVDAETSWRACQRDLESAATSARARVAELEADASRHAQELAETRAREEHTRELVRNVTEDRDGIVARVSELARVAEEARAAATAESEAIRAALGAAQALIIEAEDEAQRARAESERHQAELQAVQGERDQLAHALANVRSGQGDSERDPSSALDGSSRAVPGSVADAAEAAAAVRAIVAIVGGEDVFAAAPPRGIRVAILEPDPRLTDRLSGLRATHVVVNLANAGGLNAVASLRAEGYCHPVWGCLAVPGGAAVVPLGRIETAPRELDPEAVLALLDRPPGCGGRLLAIGTVPDRLLALRQSLTRAGVSVSIAWDAKQAADLLAMVRPEFVIVDLALPSRAGYRIVANLAVLEPQPLTVLLPAEGDDTAAAFAAAFAERSRRGGAISHAEAVQAIVKQRAATK
jgi:CheY-like chemotaxis protein